MRKRAALTLIELLVAALIFAIIGSALAQAFAFAVRYQTTAPTAREAVDKQIQFESRVKALLETAYLSSSATDNGTYFISTIGGQAPNPPATGTTGTAGTTGTTTPTNSSSGLSNSSQSADGIVFTAAGMRPAGNYLETTVTDLQQLNDTYGPQGGVDEVSLSTTPVGDAGDKTGLFIREQRPADTDYTQGGTERLLNADVASVGFEFFNGTDWIGGWDSTASGQRHLPAAVRITYTLTADPNNNHVFVVRIPLSDVTPQNPVSNGATVTTPGTGSGTTG